MQTDITEKIGQKVKILSAEPKYRTKIAKSCGYNAKATKI